jgi:hypothetical protein
MLYSPLILSGLYSELRYFKRLFKLPVLIVYLTRVTALFIYEYEE